MNNRILELILEVICNVLFCVLCCCALRIRRLRGPALFLLPPNIFMVTFFVEMLSWKQLASIAVPKPILPTLQAINRNVEPCCTVLAICGITWLLVMAVRLNGKSEIAEKNAVAWDKN